MMDEKVIDLIRDGMKDIKNDVHSLEIEIKNHLDDMNNEIKKLSAFYWKIAGGAMVVSFFVTVLSQIILEVIKTRFL